MSQIFKLLAASVMYFSVVLPVWANEALKPTVDVQEIVSAANIRVCSEIKGLNADTITRFAEYEFENVAKPRVTDGMADGKISNLDQVLLIAVKKQEGANHYLKECLSDFRTLRKDITEVAYTANETVGTRNFSDGTAMPAHYAPVQAGWTFERSKGWLIIYFTSLSEETEATRQALPRLFDLPLSACADNPACPTNTSN